MICCKRVNTIERSFHVSFAFANHVASVTTGNPAPERRLLGEVLHVLPRCLTSTKVERTSFDVKHTARHSRGLRLSPCACYSGSGARTVLFILPSRSRRHGHAS
jgi:hypothetical protein